MRFRTDQRVLTRARGIVAAVLAALLFTASWLYRFNDPGGTFAFLTDDHFFYVVRGWQILFGDLPVRDFVDHGAPLFYYISAAVQVLFGRGTLSEIAFCVTVLSASAVGVFLLAARASGSLLLGVAGATFHILLDPRFYNYPKILTYVAAIPLLWAFADRPGFRQATLVALVTVMAFLLRHDHGAFIAVAFAVLLVVLRTLSWSQRIRHALVYAAMVLAMLAPYLVFIELNGGIASYFRTAVEWAERDRGRAEVVWPGLFDNPDGVSPEAQVNNPVTRAVATVHDNSVAWLYYGELALPFVALLVLALSQQAFRPEWSNAAAKVAVVAVLAIMLNAGFLRSPLAARLADPSVPHAVLVAWLPAALAASIRRPELLRQSLRGRILSPATRAVGLAVAAVLLAILGIAVTDGLHRRLEKAWLTAGPGKALERADTMWQNIRRAFPLQPALTGDSNSLMTLSLYLRECTRPTDRVFMQHYLPHVVALSERGFAGGHADLRPGFFGSEAMQRLTVMRLSHQSVPVALVGASDTLGGFRDSFPLVVAYFDEHYENAGERVFDERFSIRLLVRRDAQPTREFQPLQWPCFQ
jgi:hypothetical protein